MKSFRTEVKVAPSSFKIQPESNLFFIGSCFTENIGNLLQERKFNLAMNPFGIIYNPYSIANALQNIIDRKSYTLSDLNQYNDLWFSFDHHGRFNAQNSESCLEKINSEIKNSATILPKSHLLFITLGTSIVYSSNKTGQIVANCHKLPGNEFTRRFLSVEEIVSKFSLVINKLSEINPEIRIVLTVSPVRHWSEGAIDNQLSKSILFIAVDQLKKMFSHMEYFPAYEIVMDDLRDYRFYDKDMLHPSQVAIDYIWNIFKETYFDHEANELCHSIEKLIAAANHKTSWPDSDSHKIFRKKNLEIIEHVKKRFPQLNLSNLEEFFG